MEGLAPESNSPIIIPTCFISLEQVFLSDSTIRRRDRCGSLELPRVLRDYERTAFKHRDGREDFTIIMLGTDL